MSEKDKDGAVRIEVEDGAAEVPSPQDELSPNEPSPEDVESTNEDTSAKEADAAERAEQDVQEPHEDELVEAAIRAGEEAAEADLAQDVDRLREERDELARKLASVDEDVRAAQAAAAESQDRLLRLQADWENFRRRTAEERLREKGLAAERLVSALLPVIDDLERAITHANEAGDEQAQQLADGVAAVRTKMLDALAHEGVEPIDPAGEPFEPLSHQAVGRVENADEYEDTVSEVYQLGYRMAGKVIRPAMVTVTYGGERRPTPEENSDEA